MKSLVNRTQTLEEIEKESWAEPQFDSQLARECHRLRKVPVNKLSTENLRLLISQNISLNILVPLALEILESNPLAEGKMYRGDLLASVARVPQEFWEEHPELNDHLVEIKTEVEILVRTLVDELLPSLSSFQYRETS